MDKSSIMKIPVEFSGIGEDGKLYTGGIYKWNGFDTPEIYIIQGNREVFSSNPVINFHCRLIKVMPESISQWMGDYDDKGQKVYVPIARPLRIDIKWDIKDNATEDEILACITEKEKGE